MNTYFNKSALITALCAAFGGMMTTGTTFATDHGDTALVNGITRNDARLTDYFALNRGEMLAFIIDTNPTIGFASQAPNQSQTNYIFPTDVKFTANVDNHSAVSFDNAFNNTNLGGTVVDPSKINENFTFTFTFDNTNKETVIMSSADTALGISGFYPTTVRQGDLVYVLGSGFTSDETKVRVGKRKAFSRAISDNLLVFIAPFGGSTGAITVSTETENEATDTEVKAKVTSASPLVVNRFNGINQESLKNLKTILTNTAVTNLIKAGNVAAFDDIGLPSKTFSGLIDDPFIRVPQQGKNIAAMAVELPQSLFTHGRQKILLSWGTSAFNSISGPSSDLAGRSFATMFTPEQISVVDVNGVTHPTLNVLHPSQHIAALEAREAAAPAFGAATEAVRRGFILPCQTPFQPFAALPNGSAPLTALEINCAPGTRMLKTPDVIIFDTTKPQVFPNGRELNNDQIDLIGSNYDPRVENLRRGETVVSGNDIQGIPNLASPVVNDVLHDTNFPYLGLRRP